MSLATTLNEIQLQQVRDEPVSDPLACLLDPIHAIQFALLDRDDGLGFLKLWNEGAWDEIDRDWPEWKEFRV